MFYTLALRSRPLALMKIIAPRAISGLCEVLENSNYKIEKKLKRHTPAVMTFLLSAGQKLSLNFRFS
jgi:hypothetical protein